jgi:hypothetical protein
MEFFIKKNANLPVLKLYLIKDGRSDFQNPVTDFDNASISFCSAGVNPAAAAAALRLSAN